MSYLPSYSSIIIIIIIIIIINTCRSRWEDLEGMYGYAGSFLHEPRLIAKTIVELAFRARVKSTKLSPGDSLDSYFQQILPTSLHSGSEADHKAVSRCLDAITTKVVKWLSASEKSITSSMSKDIVPLVIEALHRSGSTAIQECL
jgi:hypothetical protein